MAGAASPEAGQSGRRHAILLVEAGPLAGQKLVLAPGQSLLVGRDEGAGLRLARDGRVAREHCRIEWDGAALRVRDLASATGTLLDGLPVRERGEAKHASFVQVGDTLVSMWIEAHTPPRREPISDPARDAAAREALAVLAAEASGGRLYTVLDAARDPRVLELLREAIDPHQNLYEGVQGRALADVAPHLVRLDPRSGLLERLVTEGWGEAFGVFVVSREPLAVVRRHLRRFLMVQEEPSGRRLYFRFYDPRVLRDFLPIATPRQLGELFGAWRRPERAGAAAPCVIEAFLLEGEALEVVRIASKDAQVAPGAAAAAAAAANAGPAEAGAATAVTAEAMPAGAAASAGLVGAGAASAAVAAGGFDVPHP